jgi:hypothetical protein
MTTSTLSPETGAIEAENAPSPRIGSSARFGFRVHLYVCGKHGGYYKHDTEAEAVADMQRRRRNYGIMHCGYALERPKPRCPACESHADLMSGLGMWEDSPDCDHLPNR